MAAVKAKIVEYLKAKGKVKKEELIKKVAEEADAQERVVKAVLTKMIKKGEVKEEGEYIKLA